MRLVTFHRGGNASEPGVLRDREVVCLSGLGIPDLLSLIRGGAAALSRARAWVAEAPADTIVPLESVHLLAPLPRPPKVICIGLNYRDHAEETNTPIPSVPTVFAKFPTAVVGPGASIVLPK